MRWIKDLRLSVRWKLLIPFLIIVALAVGVLLPITNSLVTNRLETEADQRLGQIAESVARLIESSERQALLSANFVANLPEMHEVASQAQPSEDELSQMLTPRRESLDLQELSYFEPDYQPGDLALYYGGPVNVPRLQVSESTIAVRDALIAEVIASGAAISGIAISPQSSHVIGVAPVMDMGSSELQGIVMAVFFIDEPFVAEISTVLSADVGLVVNNEVIASTIDRESGYERLLQGEWIDLGGATKSTSIEVTSESGEIRQQRLVAQPLELNGVQQGSVLIAQAIDDLVMVQTDIQRALLAFTAAVALTSLIFALAIWINFARPLGQLADATREVSLGKLDLRVKVLRSLGRDEITDLGENFNVMTERLQDLYTSLEQQVQERTRELVEERNKLDEALRELAVARDSALDASRAKSTFLANMSHELRTPLNAIIGYSEMLEEDAEDMGYDTFVPDLQKIHISGKHLLQLINDILDLSKIEAGKMDVYLERFSVKDLIVDVTTTVRPLIDKNANIFEINIGDGVGSMFADLTKVRQTLFNLLSNASKFTQGGVISLNANIDKPRGAQANMPGEWLVCSVADTGIGMSSEQLKKLFREFSQADASTTRKYGGTGLGLALTKRICELMGGDITVESEVGRGSTFTFWLPLEVSKSAEGEMPKETVDMEPEAREEPVIPDDGKPIVLVIDDDPSVRDMMKRFLAKEGFHVEAANDGNEGLQLARILNPAAITLDVMMPGMDGWAVLTRLKEDPVLRDIPVIMLTIVDNKNMGFALGATDYMTKPIDRERLSSILRRYGSTLSTASILIVEDDDAVRTMMRRMLEQEGCKVEEAENGLVAIERLEESQPTLILLDLMMPVMDGFEFISELRQHSNESLKSVPVVVVTAKDLNNEDRTRLNGHVENVIQKTDMLISSEKVLGQVRDMVVATLQRSGVNWPPSAIGQGK